MTLKLIIVWYCHWLTKVMLGLTIVERTSQPRHVTNVGKSMANNIEVLVHGRMDSFIETNA